jgi:hypothetical protein
MQRRDQQEEYRQDKHHKQQKIRLHNQNFASSAQYIELTARIQEPEDDYSQLIQQEEYFWHKNPQKVDIHPGLLKKDKD